ncbi:DUF2783 domain-containing protein [Mesorhizobium sp. CAU 1741]|uniref:DUF2783 domain-containing protein n=1 Tax=Mesorhizobium sp. CAU 1741 TaxID=3140366 RepID=UPI00325AD146
MKEQRQGGDRLGPVADDFYAALMDAHEGLSFDESARLNARLILLMANDIGDMERLLGLLKSAASAK